MLTSTDDIGATLMKKPGYLQARCRPTQSAAAVRGRDSTCRSQPSGMRTT